MYQQFEAPGFLKHLVSFFYVMEHHSDDVPLQTLLPSATEINGWQYSGRWRVKFNMVDGQKEILLPNYYMVGQQTVSYNLTAEQGMAEYLAPHYNPAQLSQLQESRLFSSQITLFKQIIFSPRK